MVNDAGDEEERAFVEGMGQDAHGHGDEGIFGVEGQQEDKNAQLADGGVGEQRLDVVVADGANGAQEHGDAADREQPPEPHGTIAQGRMHAGEQVDARFDHGGRVEIGAGRRGGGHCSGQPKVEGKLG